MSTFPIGNTSGKAAVAKKVKEELPGVRKLRVFEEDTRRRAWRRRSENPRSGEARGRGGREEVQSAKLDLKYKNKNRLIF